MNYRNHEIEPYLETVLLNYGTYENYKRFHPEYHLYQELCERLPKYANVIEKLSNIKLPPLNEKGLPF